jgi:hypothetical protein
MRDAASLCRAIAQSKDTPQRPIVSTRSDNAIFTNGQAVYDACLLLNHVVAELAVWKLILLDVIRAASKVCILQNIACCGTCNNKREV